MAATSTLFATTQYETIRKTPGFGIRCETTFTPPNWTAPFKTADVCPPSLQADNQESGVLALVGAVFRQAFKDWEELKKAEADPKTHRQAKSALRKMEKTFCDSSENALLLLYCSGLNIEPSGIFRAFPSMLAEEVESARARAESKKSDYTRADFISDYGWYNNN